MIGLFVRHPVAPNLLMALMILAGAVALGELDRQYFPDVTRAVVTVDVAWTGAGAEDVANRITLPLHAELRTLDGLEEITSTTSDGRTSLRLKFREETEIDEAVDEIKDRLNAMRSLPESAGSPAVAERKVYETIATLLLTGPESRVVLRRLARSIKRDLLDVGIDRVEIGGDLEEEVAIQVASTTLRELGLSLDAIADRVDWYSRDMPAGTVGRDDFAIQLRALAQRRREVEFERILVLADERGRRIEIGDVAVIERRPRPNQIEVLHEGRPAVVLDLQRSTVGDTLELGKKLRDWLEKAESALPPSVTIHVLNEPWSRVWDRLALLLKNGGGGLVLVLVILFLLLNGRVAFWVAIGIPVSFMAALAALWLAGGSINMVSLIAFIMAIGIVVDDAIVVGEDGLAHFQRGAAPAEAAERGARRMLVPVMASALTTIAAFVPLLMVGGFIGQLLFQIPLVVICVIAASVVECFLILPGHLRAHFPPRERAGRMRTAIDAGVDRFRDRVFRPMVRGAVAAPAIVLALGLAMLLAAAGLVLGGHLKFHFFPTPERSFVHADVRFVAGTPRERMRAYVLEVERALRAAEREVGEDFVRLAYVRLGADEGAVAVQLVDSDRRRTRNAQVMQAWERHVPDRPGVDSVVISEAATGPPGADSDTKIVGGDPATLKAAASEVVVRLAAVPGTLSVADNMPHGRRQLVFELTPVGEALGFTVADVGRQLRAAYDGRLAQVFQDEDAEIEVRVMLPDAERNRLASLGAVGVVAPSGATVRLDTVVNLRSRRGFDVLRHTDGRLAVNVTANIDARITTARDVNRVLFERILPEIGRRHTVEYSLEGRSRTEERTLEDMRTGLVVALALIFLILAWVFGSYGLPLLVMTAIPFGLVGVLVGHYVMDIDASMLSVLGFFALSGIVVNNSIVLVTFYERLRERLPGAAAIEEAACLRLRAVLLTSFTTVAGLTPLMFETSLQAQFLIPIAVTIAFGLAFSSLVVLFFVPALLAWRERFVSWNAGRRGGEE